MTRFATLLIDPPWKFQVWSRGLWSGNGRLADAHYPTQGVDWIASLPIAEVAAKDCALLLWTPCPTLPEAFCVLKAWGFSYKTTAFVWVKTNRDGTPRMGMGYWTRANAELCLLATRGNPKRRRRDVRQVILARNRAHSQKPEEQYARIEALLPGPYLEVFARPGLLHRENWTQIGNEATGRDVIADLCRLSQGSLGL